MNRLRQIALRELLTDGSYTAEQKADDYKWLLNEWLKREHKEFEVISLDYMLSFRIKHKGATFQSRIIIVSDYDTSSQFILELEEILVAVNEEINNY